MSTHVDRERTFHDQRFADPSVRANSVRRFYTINRSIKEHYRQLLLPGCAGTRVLEYGCGVNNLAVDLAKRGAEVVAIDISQVALETAAQVASAARVGSHITFQCMNAEVLAFNDNSFDIVCGTGILHHLNLEQALAEVVRILRTDGKAVFVEPLGHNVLINLYRRLTPAIRSPDEHPLRKADLDRLHHYFGSVRVSYYYLTALAATPFAGKPGFATLLSVLEQTDRVLLHLPLLRYQAWQVLIEVSQPLK
jgi:ubiquinone/menaquinone biosynthesis C-methylase UbiE